MRKALKENEKGERRGRAIIAVATLAVSLATFGCTTTDTSSTMSGQPRRSAPAAGNMSTAPTSTPGSSSGTVGIPPQGMVSNSMGDLDSVAVLRADQAYGGVVLGPAADGVNAQAGASLQQVTGQAAWPSLAANPQITVNSSISSAPTPAIPSNDGGLAVIAVPSGGVSAGVVAGAINAGAMIGAPNTGVTGTSNTTATPTTNTNASATVAGTQGSGLVTAINPATGNAIATPTFGTSPRLNVDNGIGAPAVVGDINVTPGTNGGNATANGIVLNGRSSGLTAGAVTGTRNNVTAGVTAGTATTSGVARGDVTLGGASMTASPTIASGNVVIQPTTARRRAVTSTSTGTGNVQIVTGTNGAVTVTNVKPSPLRRAVRALGFGRTRVATPPASSSTTSTGTGATTSKAPVDRQALPDQQQQP